MLQLPMTPKEPTMYSWEEAMRRLRGVRRVWTQVGDVECVLTTPKSRYRPSRAAITHDPWGPTMYSWGEADGLLESG